MIRLHKAKQVRWHDGTQWQTGWLLHAPDKKPIEWHPAGTLQLVLVDYQQEPVFVDVKKCEPMPAKDITSETKQGCEPIYKCTIEALHAPHSQAVIDKARADAADLLQRLTESQQELAKLAALLPEMAQELAEVKAERDRLAGQVEHLKTAPPAESFEDRLAKAEKSTAWMEVELLRMMIYLKRKEQGVPCSLEETRDAA